MFWEYLVALYNAGLPPTVGEPPAEDYRQQDTGGLDGGMDSHRSRIPEQSRVPRYMRTVGFRELFHPPNMRDRKIPIPR